MATVKAPLAIDMNNDQYSNPSSQAVGVVSPGPSVFAVLVAPLYSTFHVDAGGGQYAYPTSSG